MGSILYLVSSFEDILETLRERTRFLYLELGDGEVMIIARPLVYQGKIPDEHREEWNRLKMSRGTQVTRILTEDRLVIGL